MLKYDEVRLLSELLNTNETSIIWDSLASEMVAFSNSQGGTILIGVDDHGKPVGPSAKDVKRINQLISNAASQHVRGPISPLTRNVPVETDKTVILLTVPDGMDTGFRVNVTLKMTF